MMNTVADTSRRIGATDSAGATVATAGLWVLVAGAWVGAVLWARMAGNGPGTMGLGFAAFAAMWALMMTAMMLPPTVTVAGRVGATVRGLVSFTGGYLGLWALTALPAYAAGWAAGRVSTAGAGAATGAAVAVLLLAGWYQLSRAKAHSLRRCRLHSIPAAGRSAAAAGARHAVACITCSWAGMLALIVFGVMNVPAMAVIAGVLVAERVLVPTKGVRVLVGVAAVAMAVVVAVDPSLAVGVHAAPRM